MNLRAGCLFALLTILPPACAASTSATATVVEYQLGDGLVGRLEGDGLVQIGVLDGALWRPLVRVWWPQAEDRRTDPPPAFTATAREGDPGGRRGFSRDADDDGDGLIDEDPLDGRDNDGDGLIDEDYAAISHSMGVWDLTVGERGRHLETYHWTYQHLASLVAAVYSQHGGGVVENLRISLVVPGSWLPLDEVCPPESDEAFMPQFIAQVRDPRPGRPPLWVGAVLLDVQPRQGSERRIRIEREDLIVPPLEAHQSLALAAGATRLQVVHDLRAAKGLQDGVEDPVSGQRVPWLPPAKRQELPPDLLPAAQLLLSSHDRFSLVFRVADDHYRRWDPDLFLVDGEPLGPAARLVWSGEGGGARTLAWSGDGGGRGDTCRPYALLEATGDGILEIQFAASAPVFGTRLEAVLLDGRRASLDLALDDAALLAMSTAEKPAVDQGRRLQLAPALLVPSPNPFQAVTRISFQVPGTYGEAFEPDQAQVLSADPQQRMPYADGAANVLVTVYNLEGRELATLFAGLATAGTYEAHWDGRDQGGRLLASGTYFCRLQVEQWSVTRRLIFIR